MNVLKFLILTLVSILVCSRAHADVPAGYVVNEITPQRYLFENKATHSAVVISFDAVSLPSEDVDTYIHSARFLQDAKNSRTQEALGLDPSEPFSFHASREQVGGQWVGVSESAFNADDRSAFMTERWFVRNGWSFHILITTVANQTASSESHQDIFKLFAPDLGLTPQVASIWDYLIPRAEAITSETGRSTGRASVRPSTSTSQSTSSGEHAPVRCEAEAPRLGIASGVVRHGSPAIHPALSGSDCIAAAGRIYDDAKQSFVSGANAVGTYGSSVAARYTQHVAYINKQTRCVHAAAAKPARRALSPPAHSTPAQAQSWSDWVTQSSIFQESKAVLHQAGCAIAGHVGAAVMTRNDVENDAGEMLVKGAIGAGHVAAAVGRGVVKVAGAYVYYQSPEGQLALAKQIVTYAKSSHDSAQATYNFLEKHMRGFTCLNDHEQTTVACKFAMKTAAEIAAGVATGGATAVAVRALRFGKAAEEGLALVEGVEKAQQIAEGAKKAGDYERAVDASLNAVRRGASRQEQQALANEVKRAAAANHVTGDVLTNSANRALSAVGRTTKLTANQARLVQEAHEVSGTSRTALLQKLRLLSEAGLNPAERAQLMRVGITGESVSGSEVSALEASLASNGRATASAASFVPAQERSLANSVLGAERDRPASYYRQEAASLEKRYANDLRRLDDPEVSSADRIVDDLHQKASDTARTMMRAISPQDIARTEFIGDTGSPYLRMMQLASHAGSSTSTDAGEMMAKVISELPPEKRGEFLQSLNNEFSAQNRVLAGERPPPKTGTYGRDISTVMNTTYRATVTNALGLHEPQDAAQIAAFFRRVDSSATQKEALQELMAKPAMQGVDVQEIKDLRTGASAALQRRADIAKAEERVRRAAAEKAALAALAKKDAAAAAEQVRKAEAMKQYQGLKPATVDLGRLGGRR